MSWKRLARKKVFSHPRMQVFEDTVQLPNGHVTDYVHHGTVGNAVCIIAQNDHGEVLLLREYSYPPDEWMFQLPGGGVRPKDTPEQGAARELAEEAALGGTLTKLGWFYADNRRHAGKFHVFLATNLKPASAPKDVEEEFELHWLPVQRITNMIRTGEIVNHATLASWAFFMSR
jgi:ADP-ribose pyrophosphatase